MLHNARLFFNRQYHIVCDFLYDRLNKINTTEEVDVFDFQTSSTNIKHARRYQGSRVQILKKIFKWLEVNYGLNSFHFIDIGCGRGRVLHYAQNFSFKNLSGIELCEELAKSARDNLKALDISIETKDVLESHFPSGDLCLFLFNPFNNYVLKRFLEKIEKEINLSQGRKVVIIYLNPLREYVFAQRRQFKLIKTMTHFNHNYSVNFYEFLGKKALNSSLISRP